jgi:coenzyme Q-binding protein COQ10
MPILHNKKVLHYDLELLYEIITDVESYNKFIPWCKKVTILEKKDSGLISQVEIEFLFIKEKYISEAFFIPPKDGGAKTEIKMLKGPFHHFTTLWDLQSEPSSGRTLVDFTCDFSFNNRLYDKIGQVALMAANNKILDSFMARAKFLMSEREKNML